MGSGGVQLDSIAKLGIFRAENVLEATDSDLRLNQTLRVKEFMATSRKGKRKIAIRVEKRAASAVNQDRATDCMFPVQIKGSAQVSSFPACRTGFFQEEG